MFLLFVFKWVVGGCIPRAVFNLFLMFFNYYMFVVDMLLVSVLCFSHGVVGGCIMRVVFAFL